MARYICADLFEPVKDALSHVAEACRKLAKALCDMFMELPEFMKVAEVINLPHCKIKHLALYSKKKRVRKKNLKRLLKMKG